MHFDYRTNDQWQRLNERIKQRLQLPSTVGVQVYQGIGHALHEVLGGLGRLMSHKRKGVYFPAMDPFFLEPIKFLASEGFDLHPQVLAELDDPELLQKNISAESLFVLYSVDDPLLGKVYPLKWFDSVTQLLPIFRVQVSHALHNLNGLPQRVGKFDVMIFSIRPDLAVAILGEKAKTGVWVAKDLLWNDDVVAVVAEGLKPNKWDSEKIIGFESKKVAGSSSYFKKSDQRVYDRAVIYWQDMDGTALAECLAENLGFQLRSPGEENRIETASLSRWGGLKTMDWLKGHGLTAEMIRGLVCISHELITETLPGEIEKARAQVLNLQQG